MQHAGNQPPIKAAHSQVFLTQADVGSIPKGRNSKITCNHGLLELQTRRCNASGSRNPVVCQGPDQGKEIITGTLIPDNAIGSRCSQNFACLSATLPMYWRLESSRLLRMEAHNICPTGPRETRMRATGGPRLTLLPLLRPMICTRRVAPSLFPEALTMLAHVSPNRHPLLFADDLPGCD